MITGTKWAVANGGNPVNRVPSYPCVLNRVTRFYLIQFLFPYTHFLILPRN